MPLFQTPKGEAGSDQLDAMEESIQGAIEQMFWQVAKRESLVFGVGRSAAKSSANPDWDMRLDAQKRECDGLIVFHAGKALETSMQLIYAKVNNRIPGRDYPDVSSKQMKRDRRTHKLAVLYDEILQSVETKPELREQIIDEFESLFQTAYHKGVNDLIVDDNVVRRFSHVEDAPFRETSIGGIRRGVELTMDHSTFDELLMPLESDSEFSRRPCGNFHEFLVKADEAYYGQHTMRWAHYSARDHERGRPYVVVGTRFFARLVQGLVGMAAEQWMWHTQLARRWHERRRMNIEDLVGGIFKQSFVGKPELPAMITVDEMMESHRSMRSSRTDDYDSLHVKWRLRSNDKE
ncbi:MAG: hypothetical protein OXF33_06275 [Rhodospirillales bacterium]|nr:hypothetical protein [Rhodospirillales bacterium]